MSKLTDKTLSGFIWMIMGSGVQVLLKIGVLAVLARLVSPKEFGIVGMAVVAVEFSKMFAQMGVGPAIVQRKELEERHLTAGFTLSLLMGAFFAGVLLLLAPFLADFFRMKALEAVLKVVTLVILVDSFTLTGQALMQRHMKFKILAAIEVVSYTIGFGAVGVILAYLDWGLWALVTAHLAQAGLFALLIVVAQPFSKRPGFDTSAIKELLYFGSGMTLAKVGNFIANQGDNLVIGRTLGAGALGIYGRAYQFMVMPAGLFGTALDKALFPAMAQVQNDKERLGKAFLTGVSLIALIAIPLTTILVLLAPEIVALILGPKWSSVILPFQILACSLLFRMSYKMSDSLARATGAVYRRAWRQLLYASLVVLGSFLGQFWGLSGVASGVAIALTINFLLMAHLSICLTGISWTELFKAHQHATQLGIIVGIFCYSCVTLCRFYLDSNLATILLTGLGVGLLLLTALWFYPNLFIRKDQKELINRTLFKPFKKLQPQNA